MSLSTSQIQEAAAEKLQRRYEARVKVLEIVVDVNFPLKSLRDERKHILDSGRGFRSDIPRQVRR